MTWRCLKVSTTNSSPRAWLNRWALDPDRADLQPLDGNAANRLADLVARQLGAILADLPGNDQDRARAQLELVNGVLVQLLMRLFVNWPVSLAS